MLFSWNTADPFAVLALGLFIDAAIGDARWLFSRLPHPIAIVGNLISWLDTRLNKASLSPRDARARGALILAVVIFLTAIVGCGLSLLFRAVPAGWLWEALAIAVLLSYRSLYDHVAAVAAALKRGGLNDGSAAVAHIVGRDPETLDQAGVARAAIESCAENFSDGVIAPVFWYLLLGLPGLFAYKAINTADSMIGHRTTRHRHFGWAAARIDDLVNLAPARLAGGLLASAAFFLPRASIVVAWRTMLRDAPKHLSPNAGWQEAAVAGALGLALNGPRHYAGAVHDDPWMGDGRTDLGPDDIRAALRLYLGAGVLLWLLVTAGTLI